MIEGYACLLGCQLWHDPKTGEVFIDLTMSRVTCTIARQERSCDCSCDICSLVFPLMKAVNVLVTRYEDVLSKAYRIMCAKQNNGWA